jgi:biopolymer transport protein ExbB/TolQ
VNAASWTVLGLSCLALGSAVGHAVRPRRAMLQISAAVMAVAFTAGLLGTVLAFRDAYASSAVAEPSRKASVLAQGISESMNCTAFALASSILWAIPFTVGEVRRRRLGREAG